MGQKLTLTRILIRGKHGCLLWRVPLVRAPRPVPGLFLPLILAALALIFFLVVPALTGGERVGHGSPSMATTHR